MESEKEQQEMESDVANGLEREKEKEKNKVNEMEKEKVATWLRWPGCGRPYLPSQPVERFHQCVRQL